MVIGCHLELYKNRIGQSNSWRFPLIFEAGSAGVDFFFVLSGFLITSLLLAEQENYGKIDLRKFYIRRVLRIWPLYYVVIFFCFLVVPHLEIFSIDGYSEMLQLNYWPKFLFSVFLMPNAALAFYGEIPYSAPSWSVGVEEQFYLIWPLFIGSFVPRIRSIVAFIVLFIGIKVLLFLVGKAGLIGVHQYESLKDFIVGLRFECMGIGALGAYLFNKKSKVAYFLMSNVAAAISILSLPFVLYFASQLVELHHLIFSVLFLIVILNGSVNPATFVKLENKILFTLGAISYGLYMWHPLCIGATIWIMRQFDIWRFPSSISNLIYYSSSILLTIGLSYVSYFYFERYFLRIKKNYSLLVSGNEARMSNRLTA